MFHKPELYYIIVTLSFIVSFLAGHVDAGCKSVYYQASVYLQELDHLYERNIITLAVHKVEQKRIMSDFVQICQASIQDVGSVYWHAILWNRDRYKRFLEMEIVLLHTLLEKYPLVPLPEITFKNLTKNEPLPYSISSRERNVWNPNTQKYGRGENSEKWPITQMTTWFTHLLSPWESLELTPYLHFGIIRIALEKLGITQLFNYEFPNEDYPDIYDRIKSNIFEYSKLNFMDTFQEDLNNFAVDVQHSVMLGNIFSSLEIPLLTIVYQFLRVDNLLLFSIVLIIFLQEFKLHWYFEKIQWILWNRGLYKMPITVTTESSKREKRDLKNRMNTAWRAMKYEHESFEAMALSLFARIFLLGAFAIYTKSLIYVYSMLFLLYLIPELLEVEHNRSSLHKRMKYRFRVHSKKSLGKSDIVPHYSPTTRSLVIGFVMSLLFFGIGYILKHKFHTAPNAQGYKGILHLFNQPLIVVGIIGWNLRTSYFTFFLKRMLLGFLSIIFSLVVIKYMEVGKWIQILIYISTALHVFTSWQTL